MMARYPGRGALVAIFALAGCGRLPLGHRPLPRGGETITYETTACHGSCPVYAVTLGPDGQGIFEGRGHTAVSGTRRFQATPAQVDAFTATLDRIRPASGRRVGEDDVRCDRRATDLPGAQVRWHGAEGVTSIALDYGCDGKGPRRIAAALRAAPALLPIADLIGRR